ncbi:MAG: transcriptional repressor [Candidatus Micrarchaeota archaeon]|nr:transcriptional repressor [Candidatus Micrarchaeota archaeon]
MEIKDEFLKEQLLTKGIKPSNYRILILRYLLEKKSHPTVDMVYAYIKTTMPVVSRTTVYNTLDTFAKNRLVQVITIEDIEKRYDADVSTHGHFKCEVCKSVYDFFFDASSIEQTMLQGFMIKEKHIYFKGTCEKCMTQSSH